MYLFKFLFWIVLSFAPQIMAVIPEPVRASDQKIVKWFDDTSGTAAVKKLVKDTAVKYSTKSAQSLLEVT